MEDHTNVNDLKDIKDIKKEEIKDDLITVIYDFTYSESVRLNLLINIIEKKARRLQKLLTN